MSKQAETAYDHYCQAVGHTDPNGRPLPAFAQLPANHQAAWSAAIEQALPAQSDSKPPKPQEPAPPDSKSSSEIKITGSAKAGEAAAKTPTGDASTKAGEAAHKPTTGDAGAKSDKTDKTAKAK